MTSICNYSHPDLQITTNLTRHGSGTLFPYNPEFYELASGLYGPGAIICWQLLLLSTLLSRIFHPKDRDGIRRPGMSVDLLGVLAYPTFAATDAVIHALKLLGTPHRALAVFCLRYPSVELAGFGAIFNSTTLDLRQSVPADVLHLGQHAVDLTGPLDVCYMFMAASHVQVACWFFSDHIGVEPTVRAGWLTFGTYIYVVVLLWITHLSLGNMGISMLLWMYETIFPFMFIALLTGFVGTAANFGAAALLLSRALLRRDKTLMWDGLKVLGAFMVVAVFITGPILVMLVMDSETRFVPDLGVSVTDRDQLATLLVGIATLIYTVYEIWHRSSKRQNREDVEMQSLMRGQAGR